MSEDVTARLRALAKDFSHGRVDGEAYRRSRTALLDSLVSGPVEASRPEGPVRPLLESAAGAALAPGEARQSTALAPGEARQSTASGSGDARPLAALASGEAGPSAALPPGEARPLAPAPAHALPPAAAALPSATLSPTSPASRITFPWRRSRAPWIAACALLLLALAIGVTLMLDHSAPGVARDSPASTTPPDRILDLVSPLMSDPEWSEARIAAVNAALLEEGSRQIALRQQTGWFQRFAVEVRRRLAEERASGSDRLLPEKSSLAALAVTIGLDPVAPERPLRPPIGGSSAPEGAAISGPATK